MRTAPGQRQELDVPTGATARPNDDMGSPRLGATPEVGVAGLRRPFAWQDGRRLWILDGGANAWVLAELLFEPAACRYLEVRRSSYRWPREAAGALLGRTFAGGASRAADAARGLSDWMAQVESAS
jgi:hypothetical protein